MYLDAYVMDLKYVYVLNVWPFCGHPHDWNMPQTPHLTIDEVMEQRRKELRPWGGHLGFTWPKLNTCGKPSLTK
jgi:hypothetical protein